MNDDMDVVLTGIDHTKKMIERAESKEERKLAMAMSEAYWRLFDILCKQKPGGSK